MTIALAYAGRQEIVDAAKELVAKPSADSASPLEVISRINAEALAGEWQPRTSRSFSGSRDSDVRRGVTVRLPPLAVAYAEYLFVDVFWPAFRRVDFRRCAQLHPARAPLWR